MKNLEQYLKEFGLDLLRVRSFLKTYGINELTMVTVFEEFLSRFEKGETPKDSHTLDKMILARCKEIEGANFKDMVNEYLATRLGKYQPPAIVPDKQEIAEKQPIEKQETAELFPTFKKGGQWITELLRWKVTFQRRQRN